MESRLSIVTLGVRDIPRSLAFYRDGLGFSTSADETAPIVFFRTSGTCLALYPIDKLAEDVGERFEKASSGFSGVTLAHNVREKSEVDQILNAAADAGARIEKPAGDTFWGGYSGYFSDPDGHLWEVAWGAFEFNEDGSLIIP